VTCLPALAAPQEPAAGAPEAEAQEVAPIPAGHSHLGEPFHEGPRQFAYLMGGTGHVHFAVQTSSADAQAFFDQGLGQLHGFWYLEAERSFRQAAFLDPACAMAYWGMAMANVDNDERARGFAHEAWLRRDQADAIGRAHIEALARFYRADRDELGDAVEVDDKQDKTRRGQYVTDLEEILLDHGDHIETIALLVNQLWLDSRHGRPISSKIANQALLDKVFAADPDHPAHHYRIHLWDHVKTAKRVTDAAAQSGPSSPKVAHQWHMAGHIWAKLDRHAEAAWSQEASARVDHAHMMRDRVLPDEIHNFAHNNEWLTRSLRHVGRVQDAIDLAKNMLEMPRHPDNNVLAGGRSGSARYGRRNLIETLEMFEEWQQLLDLSQTMFLEPGDEASDQGRRLYALAQAHSALGHLDGLQEARDGLHALCASLTEPATDPEPEPEVTPCDAPETSAPEPTEDPSNDEPKARDRKAQRTLDTLERYRTVCDGLLAYHGDEYDTAFELLEKGRADSELRARLLLAAGRASEAVEIARKAARNPKGETHPLAQLAWILHQAGESEDAAEAFEKLRPLCAHAQLSAEPFARLSPLARRLGYGDDWRPAAVPATDAGQDLDLDALGPRYWSPSAAPDFSGIDGHGVHRALADYRGRPVLVIFFLGFGCVHCVEQLQAFRPETEAYRAAGIEIVAIGTETARALAQTLDAVPQDQRYPFPIVADPEHRFFRAYRAFDDFESLPLHGTFLIDGDGLVRWQDVGPEPFMDTGFLLAESQRLLALPVRDTLRAR